MAEDYGCGYCGSPSCLIHFRKPVGRCPFAHRNEGWNLESIESSFSKIFDIPRGRPYVQEVEPCAERDSYTIEGIYRDPVNQEISALFHDGSLARMMNSLPFTSVKWSKQLGYGMATLENGTRVHVHTRGKVIIRRSGSRDDAENTWKMITSAVRPTLMSKQDGFVLWEALLFGYHNGFDEYDISDFLRWYDEGGNESAILAGSSEIFRKIDGIEGDRIRNEIIDILSGSETSDELADKITSFRDGLTVSWREKEKQSVVFEQLAIRVHYLRALRAIDGLRSLSIVETEEKSRLPHIPISFLEDTWNGTVVDSELSNLSLRELDDMKGLMKAVYYLTPASFNLRPAFRDRERTREKTIIFI